MRDSRRRFNKGERTAIFLAADGKSELSGELLKDDWHADHIIPWSKGGMTDVNNGEALTPGENIKKGDNLLSELRAWQQEYYIRFQEADSPDFSLAGLPGCGKTRGTMAVVSAWLAASPNRRVVIVAPTKIVQQQWQDVAHVHYKLSLSRETFAGSIGADFVGAVTTYQAVASQPFVFRRLCSKYDVMVVFDEIHHAGDKQTWGKTIGEAFETSKRRICLSGTPFRHDSQKIPFLRIGQDGFYEMDFIYDYPRAIAEGVVREISFHHYGGSVEVAQGEEVFNFHTNDELKGDNISKRLLGLLRSSKFTRGLLIAANEKLSKVRRAKPDAAALALAIDANHAVEVAKLLQEITGEFPDVLVSDSDIATINDVEKFRKDPSRKWIVAVRMVSEGVDVPRLMVLAYLTTTATELFFRQAIGRIVRSEGTDADTESYCFLPDDPRLRGYAATIEEFQRQITTEEEADDRRRQERNEEIQRRFLQILGSSEAELARITLRGRGYDDHPGKISDIAAAVGITENDVAAVLESYLSGAVSKPQNTGSTKEARMVHLRRQCNRLANQLARKEGKEPKDIHGDWMRVANVRQSNMTEIQLEAKRTWLLKRLNP